MPPYRTRDHHPRSMVVEAKWGGRRPNLRSWVVVHESESLVARVDRLLESGLEPQPEPPLDPWLAPRPARPKSEQQLRFEKAAEAVRELAMFASSLDTIRFSEAYIQILVMGPAALPYLMQVLREDPDVTWLPALAAISGVDAAEGIESVDGAVDAWLRWGVERGLAAPAAA